MSTDSRTPASRVFGPKTADHPTIGRPCPVCRAPFREGDYTVLVGDEPADDDERAKRDAGRAFTAIADEAHATHFPKADWNRDRDRDRDAPHIEWWKSLTEAERTEWLRKYPTVAEAFEASKGAV